MQTVPLDYAGVLTRLLDFQGQEVDVGVFGLDHSPPLCVSADGVLSSTDFHASDLAGYHRDTLALYVGDVLVTLHPDHFRCGEFFTDGRAATVRITMGTVVVTIRGAAG